MNRFQKQQSKEIKQLMKSNGDRFITYRQARHYWNSKHRYLTAFSPCDACVNDECDHKVKPPIVYCPTQVTVDMKLVRALRLLPTVMGEFDKSILDFNNLT